MPSPWFPVPREITSVPSAKWSQLRSRFCACGKEECPDKARHAMKALIEKAKADPTWEDPASFPVPRD